MTPEQRQRAVDKFLGDLNGKVDAATLEKAKSMLDPTKADSESLMTALATGLQNGYMAQADYAKKTQELANARREVERFKQEYLDKTEALETWQRHLESNVVGLDEFNAAQQQIQLLQAQRDQALGRLNELGVDFDEGQNRNGLPPGAKMQEQNQNQNSKTPVNSQSPNSGQRPENPLRYLTTDQFQNSAEQLAGGLLLEAAKQSAMAVEHQQLTGKPLDIVALTQEAIQAGKTPERLWQEKFDIEKLRVEAKTKAEEARIEFLANERAAKIMSEARATGQSQTFKNAGPYTYRAAFQERGVADAPKPADFQFSAEQATMAAVREYEALGATGKFTDGQTLAEASREMGMGMGLRVS